MLALITFNQYNTEVPDGANKTRKEIKGTQFRKEERKLSFAYDCLHRKF